MIRRLASILTFFALIVCAEHVLIFNAEAQQSQYTAEQFNVQPLNSIPAPNGLSAVSDFETGSTVRYYWVIAHSGGKVSAPASVANFRGPVTLSASVGSRVLVSWLVIPNTTYDVLESSTAVLPQSVTCGCAVVTNTQSGSVYDIGSYVAYSTLPTPGFNFQLKNQFQGNIPELDMSYNGQTSPLCTFTAGQLSCNGNFNPNTSAPNMNVVYASPNCNNQINCYPVHDDTRWVGDATAVNASTTVTCPNSDCNFTVKDVGKNIFGSSDGLNGSLVVPLGTITVVNSAQSVNVSIAATASQTGTLWLFWGTDDTANLQAFSAALGNNCQAGVLPSGMMWDTSALFTVENGVCRSQVAIYLGSTFRGQGIGNTVILLAPNFDFSTCTGDPSGTTCFGGKSAAARWRDFTIWGGGISPVGTHNNIMVDNADSNVFYDVDLEGFGATTTGLIGFQNESTQGGLWEGDDEDFGITACQNNITSGFNVSGWMIGSFCRSDAGAALTVVSGSLLSYNNLYFSNTTASQSAIVSQGAILYSQGDQFRTVGNNTAVRVNGIGYFDFDTFNPTAPVGSFGLFVSFTGTPKGIAHVQNSKILGGSGTGADLFIDAGAEFDDEGGNTYVAGGAANTNNGFTFGSSSIPGLTANLPVCSNIYRGQPASVSDANTPTWGGVLVGGGSSYAVASCNGTNWIINGFGSAVTPALQLQSVGITGGAVGTTPVNIATISNFTFPASGGPWRANFAYQVPLTFTLSVTDFDCHVSDGTNSYVPMATANSNGAAGGHTNGNAAGWSTVTYANGATKTFNLTCVGNAAGTTVLSSNPTDGVAAQFQMLPVAAN